MEIVNDVEIRLVVDNFSIDDDAQVNALYAHFDAVASSTYDIPVITVTAPGSDGKHRIEAAKATIQKIEQIVGLHVVDLDLDLVDLSEIASRTRKTRQAVSLIANGRRGSDFPKPYAVPGGHRIWTWASVNGWLADHRPDWADPLDHLTRSEQRELAAWIVDRCRSRRATTPHGVSVLDRVEVRLVTTHSEAAAVGRALWQTHHQWDRVIDSRAGSQSASSCL